MIGNFKGFSKVVSFIEIPVQISTNSNEFLKFSSRISAKKDCLQQKIIDIEQLLYDG